jgi:(S)-2-hydroxy-acid oxidase
MTYQTSTFAGDNLHTIPATGDCCTGDKVAFERATFSGSFRNAKFAGFELVIGEIVADSYGDAKQQHTFTLMLANGQKTMIKGRNPYANGVYRQPWANEADRREVLDEKHCRGDFARSMRDIRKAA